MLKNAKDLEKFVVNATDGEIGEVSDLLLEDDKWTVRYLVVQTTGQPERPRVLISPVSVQKTDWPRRRVQLALTREKVMNSPSVELDKPVSRQHEREQSRYYGYPPYWGGAAVWGMGMYPGLLAATLWTAPPAPPDVPAETGDAHLRSASELRGYHIHGTDGTVGHVDDFILDDETWELRYLALDTSNWWFGKKVLIAPQWATRVSWPTHEVFVDLTRKNIKSSPEWDASAAIDRDYEAGLYRHYGRPEYWGDHPAASVPRTRGAHQHPR